MRVQGERRGERSAERSGDVGRPKKRREKTPRGSSPSRAKCQPEDWRYSSRATRGVRPRAITGRAAPRARVRARRSRSDATRVCEWCVRSPRAGHASARATRAETPAHTRAAAPHAQFPHSAPRPRVVTKREKGERGGRGRARRETARRAAFAACPSRGCTWPRRDERTARAAAPISITRAPARAIWRAMNARVSLGKNTRLDPTNPIAGRGWDMGHSRRFPRVPRRARTTS